jgi:transcriptional regulator with XRE-family HTH domain
MDRSRQLAQFLRARRARIDPEDVGISNGRRRRVPGLRREEVAGLAGLSADYYTRLEQSRGHRPSEQVLRALAQALQLDADATAHLFFLGRAVPSDPHHDPTRQEDVSPELQELLDSWITTPAVIHSRWLDVLASNAVARALTRLAEPGTNMLRAMFLEPDVRDRYDDPQAVQARGVAYLRGNIAGDADDARLNGLIEELSLASETFRRLWAQHDVQLANFGDSRFFHPLVGATGLRYHTFAVEGADGLKLMVVHAAPGGPDAQALDRLAASIVERAD